MTLDNDLVINLRINKRLFVVLALAGSFWFTYRIAYSRGVKYGISYTLQYMQDAEDGKLEKSL